MKSIMEEFLYYKHVEHVKRKPIGKGDYHDVLSYGLNTFQQMVDEEKDVLGNVLNDCDLKNVKTLAMLFERELNLLNESLKEE